MIMSSPAWILLSLTIFPPQNPALIARNAATQSGSSKGEALEGWRAEKPHIFCNRQSDYQVMAGREPGLVMSNLNIGPAIPVFTHHNVVGGPYHRNGKEILDIGEFFATDLTAAERITRERGIKYVAYCEDREPLPTGPQYEDALAVRIVTGKEPAWLERLSVPGERLQFFRVRLP
jgi:hypothetical protein